MQGGIRGHPRWPHEAHGQWQVGFARYSSPAKEDHKALTERVGMQLAPVLGQTGSTAGLPEKEGAAPRQAKKQEHRARRCT
eukprot:scaffold32_cov368-Prasinococcus_capsulatus_cf.AAC.6